MANRRNTLEIIVSVVTQPLEQGLRGAIRTVRDFGGTLRSIGSTAANMWRGFTQGVFFAREAVQTLINTAQSLFDVLLSGSIDARRFEATLTRISGSADTANQMMTDIEQTAENLGLRFEDVAWAGQQLAISSRNADGSFDLNKWNEMQTILRDLSALRPDVPFQLMARGVTAAASGDMTTLTRLLDVNVNQLLGLQDAADEVLERGGQLQGVAEVRADEMKTTAQGGLDALRQLSDAVGATGLSEQLAGEFEGVSGQIREELKDVVREIGDEVLPVLTEKLQELLDFYRENEDEIEEFAEGIGEVLAAFIDDIDWQQLADDSGRLAENIERIFDAARQGGAGNITIPGTSGLDFLNGLSDSIGTPQNALPNAFGGSGLSGNNPNNAAPLLGTILHGEPISTAVPLLGGGSSNGGGGGGAGFDRRVVVEVRSDTANRFSALIDGIMQDAIRDAFEQVFGGNETELPVPRSNLNIRGGH